MGKPESNGTKQPTPCWVKSKQNTHCISKLDLEGVINAHKTEHTSEDLQGFKSMICPWELGMVGQTFKESDPGS